MGDQRKRDLVMPVVNRERRLKYYSLITRVPSSPFFRRDSWRYLIPDPYNWKGKCWRAQDYQFVIPRKVQKLSISWQSVTEVLTNLRCGAQSVCCAASINNITGSELTFLKTTILGIFCSPATLSPVAKKSWRLFKIFVCAMSSGSRQRQR